MANFNIAFANGAVVNSPDDTWMDTPFSQAVWDGADTVYFVASITDGYHNNVILFAEYAGGGPNIGGDLVWSRRHFRGIRVQ